MASAADLLHGAHEQFFRQGEWWDLCRINLQLSGQGATSRGLSTGVPKRRLWRNPTD